MHILPNPLCAVSRVMVHFFHDCFHQYINM